MNNNCQENVHIDKWIEILESEFESIAEKLLMYKPTSLHVYNLIIDSLDWRKKNEDTQVKIYCNPRWQGSTIVTEKIPVNRIAIFSPHKNYSSIETALKDIYNWGDGPVLFYAIQMELSQYLEEKFFSERKIIGRKYVYDILWTPTEVACALKIDCPDDMYLSKLEECHTATVHSNWPYEMDNSFNIIRDMIKNNDSVGLFRKEDSVLVSWVLNTFYGIGMLHTLDEYRRKGYGTLVLKKLSNNLAKLGRIPVLQTLQNNHAAKALFTSIGFIYAEPLTFVNVA